MAIYRNIAFVLLLLAASLSAVSLAYNNYDGYYSLNLDTSITASATSNTSTICADGAQKAHIGIGNSVASSPPSGAITTAYSCSVTGTGSNDCSSSGTFSFPSTFSLSCPSTSGTATASGPQLVVPGGYGIGSAFTQDISYSSAATNTYLSSASLNPYNCVLTASITQMTVSVPDACCSMQKTYCADVNYKKTHGTACNSDPTLRTAPSATELFYTDSTTPIPASKSVNVVSVAKQTLQAPVTSSITYAPSPATGSGKAPRGGNILYNFTLTNSNSFPLTITGTTPPSGGSLNCPTTIPAGSSVKCTGSVPVTSNCSATTQALGKISLSGGVDETGGAVCANTKTWSLSNVDLGSFAIEACAAANKCPLAPTVTCSQTSLWLIPGQPNPTTTCSANSTDPDNGPTTPLVFSWLAPSASPSSAGNTQNNVFTYSAEGSYTITATCSDGSCTNSTGASINVTQGAACSAALITVNPNATQQLTLNINYLPTGYTPASATVFWNDSTSSTSSSCSGGTCAFTHTYATAKTYAVSATLTKGARTTTCTGTNVVVGAPTNFCPTPAPTLKCVPTQLTLPISGTQEVITTCTANGSVDPEGKTVNYTWSAPSATPSTATSIANQAVQFKYTSANLFTITVTSSDGDPSCTKSGAVNSSQQISVVQNYNCTVSAPIPSPSYVGQKVAVNISYLPTNYGADAVMVDWGDGNIANVLTSCGGGLCTGSALNHTYSSASAVVIKANMTKTLANGSLDKKDCSNQALTIQPSNGCSVYATTPQQISGIWSSTVTVNYVDFLLPLTSKTIDCGVRSSTPTVTCQETSSTPTHSGNCTAVCSYTIPNVEGAYSSTVTANLNTVACTNTPEVKVTIGPECRDFV